MDDLREPSTTRAPSRVPEWLATATAWTWRMLVLLVGVMAVLWILSRLLVVTLPVIVALILATLCAPPATWLRDRGFKPGAAAGIVVIGGLVAIVGILAVLTPTFADQIGELGPRLADAWDAVLNWLETGPLGYDRARLENLVSSVGQRASESSGEIVSGVLTGAAFVAQAILGLLLLIVLLFFFVKDGDDITAWFIARTPPRHRDTLRAIGRRAWEALAGYVRGTAMIATIDAIGIMIGMLILGVPLVGPLTLLVFLGGFLPVIGAFTAGLIAVLVALTVDWVTAVLLLAVILGVQQLEGNFLQPTIMRRAVALHPVVVLVALTAGAALAGVVGAFLAVPVAAAVAAVGNELRLRSEADTISA